MHPFLRFGFQHLAALGAIATAAVGLPWWLRRRRENSPGLTVAIRVGLALFLAGGFTAALLESLPLHGRDWVDLLPLHLCDMAVLVGVWALANRGRSATEILYFWGLSGTVLALLMPDVDRAFPDPHSVLFFSLHGAVVVTAAVLVFGLGIEPRPRASWRVFAITNVYAAVVAVVDVVAGENFLYLREKPVEPSLLDWMGPWPWYILAGDVLAFVLFAALMLPFRVGREQEAREVGR